MCCNNMNEQYSLLSRDWGSSYTLMCNNWGEYIQGRGDCSATPAAYGSDSRIACICECHETLSPLPQTGYSYKQTKKAKTLPRNDKNNNSNNSNDLSGRNNSSLMIETNPKSSDDEDISDSLFTDDPTKPGL